MPEDEELEEEIEYSEEEVEPIDLKIQELGHEVHDNKLTEFLQQSTESVTPSLQEIETREQLEQNVAETPIQKSDDFEGTRPQVNYDTMTQEQERIYEIESMQPTQMQTNIGEAPLPDFVDSLKQSGLSISEDVRPRQIEAGTHSTKRKLPFEKEDRKYKPVEFKKSGY